MNFILRAVHFCEFICVSHHHIVCTPAPSFCAASSPAGCKVSHLELDGPYAPGGLLQINGGHKISRSTDQNSCPQNWKIWSPASMKDWETVFNSLSSDINKYSEHRFLLIDVARRYNGCAGCTNYPMKSGVKEQNSWKTSDGSAWWLRDSPYTEPNRGYRANCYLHITSINPNHISFDSSDCDVLSSDYLCQPRQGI